MSSLAIHVFKASFGPFVQLLNDHKVRYTMEGTRSGTCMSASAIFEILLSSELLGQAKSKAVIEISPDTNTPPAPSAPKSGP